MEINLESIKFLGHLPSKFVEYKKNYRSLVSRTINNQADRQIAKSKLLVITNNEWASYLCRSKLPAYMLMLIHIFTKDKLMLYFCF